MDPLEKKNLFYDPFANAAGDSTSNFLTGLFVGASSALAGNNLANTAPTTPAPPMQLPPEQKSGHTWLFVGIGVVTLGTIGYFIFKKKK